LVFKDFSLFPRLCLERDALTVVENGKMLSRKNSPKTCKLRRKEYEEELRKLQIEVCKLQEWVRHEGLRIIVIFEGRDAARKGGAIKAITEPEPRGSSASAP
jgi:polyphosphate kinase 2 (PPK2 family)